MIYLFSSSDYYCFFGALIGSSCFRFAIIWELIVAGDRIKLHFLSFLMRFVEGFSTSETSEESSANED